MSDVNTNDVLLARGVAAIRDPNVVALATKAELADLLQSGMVETGPQEKPGSNRFHYRATERGVASMQPNGGNGPQPAQAPQAPQAASSGFQLEDNVPMPDRVAKRAGPPSKYPFEAMQVGQSFFIPATSGKPEPWKSMLSTVTAAQRRFAVEQGTRIDRNGAVVANMVPVRRFKIGRVDEGGKVGARIWRIA